MPANYVSGYSYCILNKDTPKTNWEANFGCRQFLIQLGTSPCCRRTLALEMTGRTMSSPSELSSRVCPFLQTPMPAIPQACPASCSPLTPVCSFPVDSCVDTGHWCWARQTWSLFSWNLLFIARNLWLRLWFLIPARVGWCCGWTVVQSGVPVRSAFGLGRMARETIQDEFITLWMIHPHLYFLLILGCLLAFSFLCFCEAQVFPVFLWLLWDTLLIGLQIIPLSSAVCQMLSCLFA